MHEKTLQQAASDLSGSDSIGRRPMAHLYSATRSSQGPSRAPLAGHTATCIGPGSSPQSVAVPKRLSKVETVGTYGTADSCMPRDRAAGVCSSSSKMASVRCSPSMQFKPQTPYPPHQLKGGGSHCMLLPHSTPQRATPRQAWC
jgi:hypothetical protein